MRWEIHVLETLKEGNPTNGIRLCYLLYEARCTAPAWASVCRVAKLRLRPMQKPSKVKS